MSIKKISKARNTLQFLRDKGRHKQKFFKCIRHKRRWKKNSVHLLAEEGKLITDDTKKTEVLNLFFLLTIYQKVNCCLKARQCSIWSKLNQNKWEKRKKMTQFCKIYWVNHRTVCSSRSKTTYTLLQSMPSRAPGFLVWLELNYGMCAMFKVSCQALGIEW